MRQSRVNLACLLFVLLSTTAPAVAADLDIYGNQPAPMPVPGPVPAPAPQPAPYANYGYGGAEASGYVPPPQPYTVVAPQQPYIGTPQRPQIRRRPVADPYNVYGYDDGAFELRPTLQIGGISSDNVYLTPNGRQSDIGIEIRPSLSWASKWPVHAWTGNVSIDWLRFASHPDGNRITGEASTAFKLDFSRWSFAEFNLFGGISNSSAGQADVPYNASNARQDTTYGANVGYAHDFGGWVGRATFGASRNAYGDVTLNNGTVIGNSDMNYWSPSVTLKGTLGNDGATIRPFGQLTYDMRFHDSAQDRTGTYRNSSGVGAALGLQLSDGKIWAGSVAAVLMTRHYADAKLTDAWVPGVAATVNWSPANLWLITATTGVAVNDSVQAGVSSSSVWNAGLNTTYNLRDNLILRGGVTLGISGNGSGVGTDKTTVAQIGADWQLNPNTVLSATVQNTWFRTPSGNYNYDEQRAYIGVTLRP